MRSRTSRTIILAGLLVCMQPLAPITLAGDQPPSSPKAATSSQKIHQAQQAGLISTDESLLLQTVALFAPQRLPEPFKSTQLEKCGTPFLIALENRWWSLPAWLRSALSEWPVAGSVRGLPPSLSRPGLSGPEHTVATAHFLIHYTLSGADAVSPADSDSNGEPDYVDAVGQALERAHEVQVDQLDWLPPPSDEPIDPGHPAYDVYIRNISVEGLTYPEATKGDNEHSPGIVERYARYSHILLNHQLAPEILQVTAAHEYNHAIQFGYNAASAGFDGRRWLMEATAMWMEGQVFPEVKDNASYLAPLFRYPDHSLAAPETYYASWLFFQYLQEHCGGPVTIRSMWQASVPWTGDFSFQVIRQALNSQSCNIDDSFADFCIANLLMMPCELTSSRFCYEDALFYLTRVGHTTVEGHLALYNAETAYVPPDGVQQFACDYVAIDTEASSVASAGYTPLSWATIQGIWVGRHAFTVSIQPFLLTSDPTPPHATVSPHEYDSLYVLVANLTDPTDSEIRDMLYGLAFAVLHEATPTATPSPIPTLTPTASPHPTTERTHTFLPTIWAQ